MIDDGKRLLALRILYEKALVDVQLFLRKCIDEVEKDNDRASYSDPDD